MLSCNCSCLHIYFQENEAVRFLQELSEEVCNRLKSINMKGKSVTLKLMVRREDAPKETSKFLGMKQNVWDSQAVLFIGTLRFL